MRFHIDLTVSEKDLGPVLAAIHRVARCPDLGVTPVEEPAQIAPPTVVAGASSLPIALAEVFLRHFQESTGGARTTSQLHALAALHGKGRNPVFAAIAELRRDGWIKRTKRGLYVLKKEA